MRLDCINHSHLMLPLISLYSTLTHLVCLISCQINLYHVFTFTTSSSASFHLCVCSCCFASDRFYVTKSTIFIHLCPCRYVGSAMVLDSSGKNCHPPPQFGLPRCKIQERMKREERDPDLSPHQRFISTIHL